MPEETERARPAYLKAVDLVNEALRVNPHDEDAIYHASLYQAMLGNREGALALLHKIPPGSTRDPSLLALAAKIHYRLGMQDLALTELQKSVSAGYSRVWVRDDPAFAGLVSNVQFQRIVGVAE